MVNTKKGDLEPSLHNPSGLRTNCGYCAISRGLLIQQGISIDADQLYIQTLKRLSLPADEPTDPVPRTLFFPNAARDVKVRISHSAVNEGVLSGDMYAIWSVATGCGLRWDFGNKGLLSQFVANYSIVDYSQVFDRVAGLRYESALESGKTPGSLERLRSDIASELVGEAIIGSASDEHFLNVTISRSGHMEFFDPQEGKRYDGRDLRYKAMRIDLLMRVPVGN
jgi:hypothetical protein